MYVYVKKWMNWAGVQLAAYWPLTPVNQRSLNDAIVAPGLSTSALSMPLWAFLKIAVCLVGGGYMHNQVTMEIEKYLLFGCDSAGLGSRCKRSSPIWWWQLGEYKHVRNRGRSPPDMDPGTESYFRESKYKWPTILSGGRQTKVNQVKNK